MTLPIAVALVIGLVVGVLLGSRLRRPAVQVTSPPPPARIVPTRPAGQDPAGDSVVAVLRDAVDQLEIGVVVAGRDGRIVYRNDAASEWSGTHVRVLLDEHLDRVLKAARTGARVSRTVELHGPPRLFLTLLAEPMPGGAAVATITDVSDRARTDAMRTDFVANISHELKTPVGAIAVLAEALIDEDDPATVSRVAERLVDESHRAVRTIDDLLELARIELGDGTDEPVDLGSVVREALVRGRNVEDAKDVKVTALEPAHPIVVRGDRRQLVSALGNLVENAVKYSNDGGTVQVRIRVGDQWVELMVADQGVGIPPRDLDRIFERFYRVDRARSRNTGGTGLGLSIVRHVATNHGGDVQVSSRVGEGSTFVLRLPVARVVAGINTPTAGGADVGTTDAAAHQQAPRGQES